VAPFFPHGYLVSQVHTHTSNDLFVAVFVANLVTTAIMGYRTGPRCRCEALIYVDCRVVYTWPWTGLDLSW